VAAILSIGPEEALDEILQLGGSVR
jgi:hypothetical protein